MSKNIFLIKINRCAFLECFETTVATASPLPKNQVCFSFSSFVWNHSLPLVV